LDGVLRDVRHAARSIVRRPTQSLLLCCTLALGIGASTTMFSVLDAVLLRDLPFPDPDEIVSVYVTNPHLERHPTLGGRAERGLLSYPEFRALREHAAGVLNGIALLRGGSGGVITRVAGGEPELVRVGGTTPELFERVLRVAPLAGRLFWGAEVPDDGVLITEGFWRRRFGSDPAAVGSTIHFEETPRTVVGVVPEEASLPGYPVEVWTLWGADEEWSDHQLTAIARLATGMTFEGAAERLSAALIASLPAEHDGAHGVHVLPRKKDEARGVRAQLGLLALGALLLLAVACANVAALMVSAGLERERELMVRTALGAERGALVRQLVAESVLLGLVSAGLGALLASGGTRAVVLLAPEGVPRMAAASVDGRALAFAIALALASALVFGLLPALRVVGRGRTLGLGSAARGRAAGYGRAQQTLVALELALATVLLVGAGLLGRTLHALNNVDLGFAATETLALRVTAPSARLFAGVNMRDVDARAAALEQFYDPLVEGIRALPGVRGVAITSDLPLTGDRGSDSVRPEGYDGPELVAERRFVSHDYFAVMGMRLVEGRAFSEAEDRPSAEPKVVISESLARAAWPAESPIGKLIDLTHSEVPASVVGVAADVRDEDVQVGSVLAYYLPRRQTGFLGGSIVIRAEDDPAELAPAVRARIREVDPSVVVNFANPLSELAAEQITSQRFRARLIVVFSSLEVLLSLVGVYGVTARAVAARRRELGVRSALGAARSGLMRLVLVQAAVLAGVGTGGGIVLVLLVQRGIEGYLWGVEPYDPLTLSAAAALTGVACILSALGPALRASRIDPVEALRAE
jgi:predicted permease